MFRRSFSGLVVATALLFAVSSATVAFDLVDDEPAPSADESAERADDAEVDEDIDNDPADGVELLDAGDEPREVLRLRPAVGATSRTDMVFDIALTLAVDGETLEAPSLPATRVVLEQTVDRVDDDGTVNFSFTFAALEAVAGPDTDAGTVSTVNANLSRLVGLQGTGQVDARGDNQSQSVDTGGIDDPTLTAILDSVTSQADELSTPLPRQPVGVGARWRVVREATLLGITTEFTTTFTLRSRDGDRFEVDIVRTGTGRPGPAAIPGLPPGIDATLESLTSRARGRLANSLTRPFGQTGSINGTASFVFTIAEGLDTSQLEEEVTVGIEVSSD